MKKFKPHPIDESALRGDRPDRCEATTRAGKQCRRAPLSDREPDGRWLCVTHSPRTLAAAEGHEARKRAIRKLRAEGKGSGRTPHKGRGCAPYADLINAEPVPPRDAEKLQPVFDLAKKVSALDAEKVSTSEDDEKVSASDVTKLLESFDLTSRTGCVAALQAIAHAAIKRVLEPRELEVLVSTVRVASRIARDDAAGDGAIVSFVVPSSREEAEQILDEEQCADHDTAH